MIVGPTDYEMINGSKQEPGDINLAHLRACLKFGPFKCYVTLFPRNFTPAPLHYVTLEWPQYMCYIPIMSNVNTVFDLINGLFAYVILGQKIRPIYRTPLHFFFCTVSVHYAICFIFYVLCLRLSRVQNATSEDRCM